MSTTTTATLETLTAEVRTLVVGARQLTLSIAKQLDIIPLPRLTIFGRVHISKDRVGVPGYVIGADRDGTLALAKYYPERTCVPNPFIDQDDIEGGHIVVCSREVEQRGQIYQLRLDTEVFEIAARATQPCGIEGHSSRFVPDPDKCGGWRSNGHHDQISRAVQSQRAAGAAANALNKAAIASPLIVLAGLK
jgi:hypothetical protein